MTRGATDKEKTFAKETSDRELLAKIKKEVLKLNNKKITQFFVLKRAKDLNKHVTKEDRQVANKHMRKCSPIYVIKEMQIKTAMRHQYTPIAMAEIKETNHSTGWRGQQEHSFSAGENSKPHGHFGRQLGGFLKN